MDEQSDSMTSGELAAYLNVSEQSVISWAQKKLIPCTLSGVLCRFKRSEVERWAETQLRALKLKDTPEPLSFTNVLKPERVLLTDSTKKVEVFNTLIDSLAKSPEVSNRQELSDGIFYRESLMSTAIGMGIAVPHVRLGTVKNIVLAAAVCRKGIAEYETLDSIPVRLVFMIAARKDQHSEHLKLLSSLSFRLKNESFRQMLLECSDPKSFYSLISF